MAKGQYEETRGQEKRQDISKGWEEASKGWKEARKRWNSSEVGRLETNYK